MVFLIPDQILEKNTCSECHLYLSVMPVKVYPNGDIKCGRCSRDGDGGVRSMYETIIKNSLLPCIHRYDGCNELMESSKVKVHEASCSFGLNSYACPFNDFGHFRASYNFYKHVQRKHQEVLLNASKIHLKLNSSVDHKFFYCEQYLLFAIRVTFSVETKKVELCVTHFRRKVPKVPYTCVLSGSEEFPKTLYGFSVTTYDTSGNNFKLMIEATEPNINNITMKLIFDIPQTCSKYLSITQNNTPTRRLICPPLGANISLSPLHKMYGIMFQYTVNNFHELLAKETTTLASPVYFINNISVLLQIKVCPNKKLETFGLYFRIDPRNTLPRPWSCVAEVEFKIASVKPDVRDFSHAIKKEFSAARNETAQGWGTTGLNLFRLLDPETGYIKDNSVTVKVEARLSSFKIGN